MRFEASLKELQSAVKDLEKVNKKAASKKGKGASINQMDMFAAVPPANDIDVDALKKQLDDAITSMETLIKESA
jgi:hypothetical protein